MKQGRIAQLVGTGAMVGAVALTATACSSSTSEPPLATPPPATATDGAAALTDGSGGPTLTAVPLTAPAGYGNGVTAKVVKMSRATVSAQGPGEIAGAGIRAEVQITNGTGNTINLDGSSVSLAYGKAKTPGDPVLTADQPLVGSLGAGQIATATYNFAVSSKGNPVYLQVSYTGDQPAAVFVGKV